MNKKDFESLTSAQQWQWVVDNRKDVTLIELDNDTTYVSSTHWPDDYATTKSWLGNERGVREMLTAMGIENQGV